jgi:hypothetical protein
MSVIVDRVWDLVYGSRIVLEAASDSDEQTNSAFGLKLATEVC